MASNTVSHTIRHTLGPDMAREAALKALKYYTELYPAWAFDVAPVADPAIADVVMHTPIHIDIKMQVKFAEGSTTIEAQVPFIATPFVRTALVKISAEAGKWIETAGGKVL